MKSKIVLLVLMSKVLVAIEQPVSPRYRMPEVATVLKMLNHGNKMALSPFFDSQKNEKIASQLAEKEFTESALVDFLHNLTQPQELRTHYGFCPEKASLLIAAANFSQQK